jgi:hypothetical protein
MPGFASLRIVLIGPSLRLTELTQETSLARRVRLASYH